MLHFTDQTLFTIIKTLKTHLKQLVFDDILEFEVLNPDNFAKQYNGKKVTLEKTTYIHRDIKSWCTLADSLQCRFLTPQKITQNTIKIRYQKLQTNCSFHQQTIQKEEKYGTSSIFSNIDKNEDSSFLYGYIYALKNVNLNQRTNILNLGVNDAKEFDIIKASTTNFDRHNLTGIDFCKSAIQQAKKKFQNNPNVNFYEKDLNDIEELPLQKFDLIISIGTFQSSNLNFKPLFMKIVQNYLKKDGAMILGFPNCRWVDGTALFGARTKNYNYPEYSNLFTDVVFCKKYLQQKKFRVTITGKNYIFLTATSIC